MKGELNWQLHEVKQRESQTAQIEKIAEVPIITSNALSAIENEEKQRCQ